MYKTILVPVEISEDELTDKAIAHAEYLAKLSDANIHLFHSIPDVPRFSVSYSYHYDLINSFAKKSIARSEEELAKVVEKNKLTKRAGLFLCRFWITKGQSIINSK
ncbi:hypothetical protein B738_16126 [Photorhabdus temperata subsp. temperata M1021]|nr:hypothetical protein B738_16126 [Photorhabdus temperata subsp. temperata M1021]